MANNEKENTNSSQNEDRLAALEQMMLESLEANKQAQEENAALRKELQSIKKDASASGSDDTDDIRKDNEYLKRQVAAITLATQSEDELQKQGRDFLRSQFTIVEPQDRPYEWKIVQSPLRSNGKGGRATYGVTMRFFSSFEDEERARYEYAQMNGAMLDDSNSKWTPIGFDASKKRETTVERDFA